MPNWKKIIVSGSDASLNTLVVANGITGSLLGTASFAISSSRAVTASYALNGGVTQLFAGPNVTLSPTTGLGQVTISSTGAGTYYNTATGSYGAFYDTTTQTNPVANIPRSMSLNTTDITNGVSISGSSSPFNTYIKIENAGVYNIQFSAQLEKTDSGTDYVDIWLRRNGVDLTDSATNVTLSGNNDREVAAWNWFATAGIGDYYQIMWASADTDTRILAESATGVHPGIPSVIVTVNRIDTFLSNTGSFTGSFTGVLIGTASYATQALSSSFATSALSSSFATTAISASFATSASFAISSSRAITSSFALTASFVGNSLITASVSSNTITFTKGDSTTFPITIATGSGTVSSVNTAGTVNGITLTGGPITTTGTITLGGTLSNVQSSQLATSSLMVGSTNIALGATASSLTGLTSVTSTAFTGSLFGTSSWATNATTATTATNATNVAVTDTTTGTGPYYIAFTDGTTGNRAVRVDSTALTFNATTNTLTNATFSGSLIGTASFASSSISASFATSALSSSFATTSISSSFASTASFVANDIITASVSSNTITFTKGNGTTFPITVATGSATSAFPFTGSATITGSLTVTGSVNSTGGYTGSLLGTASWATNVVNNGVTSVATAGTVSGITLTGGTITSTGTITLGGSISGLTNANLSGTAGITNANLANSAITVGSTSISLGGTATTIAGLTSVTSTAFTGSLLGTASFATTAGSVVGGIGVTSVATAGTVSGITLTGGTITSTGTITLGGSISGLTNANLSGTAGITNANLANSSITVGSTGISLGATATTLTGLTSVTSTAFTGSLLGTASFATSALSSSFATTASFVNTLNQNVLITGSATIGATSAGASENSLTLGPRDSVNEGGQIGFNAPGGTYTSASFIDLYQNRLRVLRGTNAGSTAEVANWSMHSLQMSLPAYTSVSSFPGTAVGLLAFDSGGNILTTTAGGSGTVTSVATAGTVSGITLTGGTITTSGTITLGGSISGLTTSNLSGTAGITNGQLANSSVTIGSTPISLGSSATTITGLTSLTSTAFTGSLLGTASWATNVVNNGVTSVATAGSVSGITLTGGTITSTGTITLGGSISGLTNANLSGTAGITNANLANSSITVGSTAISLGSTATTIAGLTSLTSTAFTGSLLGTASWATNVVNNGVTSVATAGTVSGITLTGGTITSTGTITLGGSISGLTTSNLSGTAGITNGQLANSSITVGSTSISLGGTATTIAGLTSVTSTAFTGSLLGTASFATSALSSSFATTASFASNGISGLTSNYIPKATSATTLGDSGIQDDSTNIIIDRTTIWQGKASMGSLTPPVGGMVSYITDTDLLAYTGGQWTGEAISGIAGANITVGQLCYMNTLGRWRPADADTNPASTTLLGICLLSASGLGSTFILLKGFVQTDYSLGGTPGEPLYIEPGSGAGQGYVTPTVPTVTGQFVRIIGHTHNSTTIRFNPDNIWVEL